VDQEEQARRPEPQLIAAVAARRERGWVGVLALLVVLALVALLAGAVLREYGLAGTGAHAARDAAPSEAAGGAAPAATPTPAPREAMERARALQEAVKQQAAEYEKRIDAGSR
jgi:hypothetical protein